MKCVGFEIRIKTSRKHVRSEYFCSRLYQCRKAGNKVVKKNEIVTDDEDNNVVKGKRRRDFINGT